MSEDMRPDYAALREAGYNFLPVWQRVVADGFGPLAVLAKIREEKQHFLFESVTGGEQQARYSFLGLRPKETLIGDLKQVRCIDEHASEVILPGDDPYAAVRSYMEQFTVPVIESMPRFSGGLVGYFSYDTVRLLEHLPNMPEDPLSLPDLYLMRFDTVIAFDHSFNQMLLITHADCRGDRDLNEALAEAEAELESLFNELSSVETLPLVRPQEAAPLEEICHTSRQEYEKSVRTIKEYISAGDIFQCVPSQRFSAKTDCDPFTIYRSLRSLNPSPYLFCLHMDDLALIGASPEIMVRVEDGEVHVRPIAGTIHRGKTLAEDEALGQELLADDKEIAEHVMLIDLGRNDVGRVSKAGTVQLRDKMVIEKYSHVQHIVSHVTGELREDCDALEALRHCHPAGTVSGAPKIRAMEIIDSLEPVKRGPYAGAVGYLDFNGNMDTCIALRTIVHTGDQVHVQAGAGVVADSDPAKEYEETRKKAMAQLQAIARASEFRTK